MNAAAPLPPPTEREGYRTPYGRVYGDVEQVMFGYIDANVVTMQDVFSFGPAYSQGEHALDTWLRHYFSAAKEGKPVPDATALANGLLRICHISPEQSLALAEHTTGWVMQHYPPDATDQHPQLDPPGMRPQDYLLEMLADEITHNQYASLSVRLGKQRPSARPNNTRDFSAGDRSNYKAYLQQRLDYHFGFTTTPPDEALARQAIETMVRRIYRNWMDQPKTGPGHGEKVLEDTLYDELHSRLEQQFPRMPAREKSGATRA